MLVDTPNKFSEFISLLRNAKMFAFDTETTGLLPFNGHRIIGMSFLIPGEDINTTWYLPFRHKQGTNLPEKYLKHIRNVFLDPKRTVVTWNGKFDFHFLSSEGIYAQCINWDAQLAYHLVNENEFTYALKPLSKRTFGPEAVKDDEELQAKLAELGYGKDQMNMLLPEEVAAYAESDVELTYRMFRATLPVLNKAGMLELATEVMEYNRVIERVERHGVPVNVEKCREQIAAANTRIEELRIQIDKEAPEHGWDKTEVKGKNKGQPVPFNPMSHVHARAFFNVHSSAKEVLEELDHPLVKVVLEYRGMSKAIGSFYDPFIVRCDNCGRLHPTLNTSGTKTGRLSCTDPNMQALPRNSRQFHHARGMIETSGDNILLSADYSQAELRLLAHSTRDPFMLKAYREDLDIHEMVAKLLGRDREQTKSMNFMMVYGGGVAKAMQVFQCDDVTAERIIARHRRIMPGVRQLYFDMERIAKQHGYIKMWTGRRRRFLPHMHEHHKAMSSLIQGGVGEIVRIAMTRLDAALPKGAHMVLQVHDEILVECHESQLQEVSVIVRRCMEDFDFLVPMKSDQKYGKSWADMTKI